MSRKARVTQKIFKVFCEGSPEHNYINEMRRQKKLTITLKLVNMEGGGYRNFLEQVKTDGTTNCLAKFIIIDGDRALAEEGEKKNLRELLNYCILQNKNGKIPHFLIINDPDFEYIACMHTPKYKGQNTAQYLIKELGYKSVDDFKADTKIYQFLKTNGIQVSTTYDWKMLGKKASNINEFFEVATYFNP